MGSRGAQEAFRGRRSEDEESLLFEGLLGALDRLPVAGSYAITISCSAWLSLATTPAGATARISVADPSVPTTILLGYELIRMPSSSGPSGGALPSDRAHHHRRGQQCTRDAAPRVPILNSEIEMPRLQLGQVAPR